MKPELLQIQDLVLAPFYGKMVPCRIVEVRGDKVLYEPLNPAPHRLDRYFSNGENLEPITLDLEMLSKQEGWVLSNQMAYFHNGLTWLEWHESNKACLFGDYLLPYPICNVEQMQHIFRVMQLPEFVL